MPKHAKEPKHTISIYYYDGIENVLAAEVEVVESNLPELLKLMLEEMRNEEEGK